MAVQKLYAGAKLRDLRRKLNLTQKEFAARLGVSLPYLNQIENNNRPVSSSILLALAQEFGFDVTQLSVGESERIVAVGLVAWGIVYSVSIEVMTGVYPSVRWRGIGVTESDSRFAPLGA